MVTPVSLALVFNVVCLAKSVHTIYQLQKVGRHFVLSLVLSLILLKLFFVILHLSWWIESTK